MQWKKKKRTVREIIDPKFSLAFKYNGNNTAQVKLYTVVELSDMSNTCYSGITWVD